MSSQLRYDSRMKRLVIVVSIVLAAALLTPLSAQIHGVPPSVTSVGNPGGPASVPPNATSLGPQGYTPGRNFIGASGFTNRFTGNFGGNRGNGDFGHHHRGFGPTIVAVPVPVFLSPYPLAYSPLGYEDEQSQDDIAPGPTVFEHRVPRGYSAAYSDYDDEDSAPAARIRRSAPAPERVPAEQASSAAPAAPSAPPADAKPQPPSVLVFRDGHKVEVKNYAIVGDTLYDFTPDHQRKIALAQLDLSATQKLNDDRGVDFSVPAAVKGN